MDVGNLNYKLLDFNEKSFVEIKSKLLKLFNKNSSDMTSNDNDNNNSYVDYQITKLYDFPNIKNNYIGMITQIKLPPIPREIRMNWFKNEEIEQETFETEGLFSGYVIIQISDRNIIMYESIMATLSSEPVDNDLNAEFTDFWGHYCQHIQANFQEFENLRKTIKLNGIIDINLLYDWILLYSASHRSGKLFYTLYQNTDFPIKFDQEDNKILEYFCRTTQKIEPVGLLKNTSIISNFLYRVIDFKYLIDVLGLVNVWKIILYEKNDNYPYLQITNQLYLVFVNLLNKLDKKECNDLFNNGNENDYQIVLNMLANYKSINGNNILHYVIQLIVQNRLRFNKIFDINIFSDLFKYHGYLLKQPNNNDFLPISYFIFIQNFGKDDDDEENDDIMPDNYINKLVENNYIDIADICKFSKNIVPIFCNSIVATKITQNVLENLIMNNFEELINAYIQLLSNNELRERLYSCTEEINDKIMHALLNIKNNNEKYFCNLMNSKIKLYNFNSEHNVMILLWCLDIVVPYEIKFDHPYLLNTMLKTKKHIYKLTSFKKEMYFMSLLLKNNKLHIYDDPIKNYYKNIRKNYSLPIKNLNVTKTFFLNMKCSNVDDVCLKIYFLLEIIKNSKINNFNILDYVINTNEFSNDENNTKIIYKYFVETVLYFADTSIGNCLNIFIKFINDSYFINNKEFSDIFIKIITKNNNWFVWNFSGRHMYKTEELKNVTIDIINNKKIKGSNLLINKDQIDPIIYYSDFVTEHDFFNNFLSSDTNVILDIFKLLNMSIIKKLVSFDNFDWKIVYDTFVDITKNINDLVPIEKYEEFLNWLYEKLEQSEIYEKFIAHVTFNEHIKLLVYYNADNNIVFTKYLLFLISKKIITIKLYNEFYYKFVNYLIIYATSNFIKHKSCIICECILNLTTDELCCFFGIDECNIANEYDNYENDSDNSSIGYYIQTVGYLLNLDTRLNFEKRLFVEFTDFWKNKKFELFVNNKIGFLKQFNNLIKYNFIDSELIQSIFLIIDSCDKLSDLENELIEHCIKYNSLNAIANVNENNELNNTLTQDNNEEINDIPVIPIPDSESDESDYEDGDEESKNDILPISKNTTKSNKIILINLLHSTLRTILDNFDISELFSETLFGESKLKTFVFSSKENLKILLQKLVSLSVDELNKFVCDCKTESNNFTEELVTYVEKKPEFICKELLDLLCKYQNLELITENLIKIYFEFNKLEQNVNLFDEYIVMSINKNNLIHCEEQIIKHYPHTVLYFPKFEELLKILNLDTIIMLLKYKMYDISEYHQDLILHYVCNNFVEIDLMLVLENIFIGSNFLFEKLETLIKLINCDITILKNLISLNKFPRDILLLEDSDKNYLLSLVPVSNISNSVAKLFIELLTPSDLIQTNKRGNFKIFNFLIDPYIKYIINRSDIVILFNDKQIGQIIFEELIKLTILKQCDSFLDFNKMLFTLPNNAFNSRYVDTHSNNFYMCILETFMKEFISVELITDTFIEQYCNSVNDVEDTNILLHKNINGNNLLFLSVHFDRLFRKILKLYIDKFGNDCTIESNNNNETLLMYIIKHNIQLMYLILDNNAFDKNNSYVYVNTGSILTHAIIHQKDVDIFNDLLNWNKIANNTIDTIQQIQLFDWNSGKVTRVHICVVTLACIFNKDMFKILIDSKKINITKHILQIKTKSYDIFEVAYLYSPDSFQFLLGSEYVYNKFPNERHKNFFIEYANIQPGSWYNFVLSKYYSVANYSNNEIWKLHWAIRPTEIVNSHIAKYIQTKNEHTSKPEEICEICLNYKKKIMFGCLRHITCVTCAYKSEKCPICKNRNANKIKVLE